MADLDDILIFVKAAQYESISRAARALSMPISTVSRRVSLLESLLGVASDSRLSISVSNRSGSAAAPCNSPSPSVFGDETLIVNVVGGRVDLPQTGHVVLGGERVDVSPGLVESRGEADAVREAETEKLARCGRSGTGRMLDSRFSRATVGLPS